MKIRSAYTGNAWLERKQAAQQGAPEADQPKIDKALDEIHRALSEVIRCNNLVVLAGLGTSLCVKDGDAPKAPTMAQLWEAVQGVYELIGDWDALLALVRHPVENTNLESLLSHCKLAESFLDEGDKQTVTQFVDTAEDVIRTRVDFLNPHQALPVHAEFLRRIAGRGNRKSRARVFTTNYDLCFEQAARIGRFVVTDGFSPTTPAIFDPVYFSYDTVRREASSDHHEFIPNAFHLYKMHGSLDWHLDKASGEIERQVKPKKPLLIYPRSSKFESAFSQPYLEMMAAYQTALRLPNTGLLIIGSGFNDAHITGPTLAAIRSNLGLKVVVVDPTVAPWTDQEGEHGGKAVEVPSVREIASLIDHGDARLALLNATFELLTEVLPDLAAETDLEKHMERLRKIKGGP